MQRRSRARYVNYKGFNIAVDVRLDIFINNKYYTTLYLSPESIEEAVIGLLYGDGFILNVDEIDRINISGTKAHVFLKRDVDINPVRYDDCATNIEVDIPMVNSNSTIDWKEILRLYSKFNQYTASAQFLVAMHTTAVYNIESGEGIIVHDVSRHNTILKIVGHAVKRGIKLDKHVAFTTGRVSSDMVYRLARLGLPIIISMRGPLYSGVESADKVGVTLIANMKKSGVRRLTVLTHRYRITSYK